MATNMFILLLSVFGCVLASPTCTEEEANKCMTGDGDFDFLHLEETFPSDENRLQEFCHNAQSRLDCAIAFVERCPNSKFGDYLEGLKGQKAVLKHLCDESSDLRADYLKHVSCLNNKISAVTEQCADHMNIFADDFTCSSGVHKYKTCVEDSVKACGERPVEIFDTLYKPRVTLNTILCEQLIKSLKDLGIISK